MLLDHFYSSHQLISKRYFMSRTRKPNTAVSTSNVKSSSQLTGWKDKIHHEDYQQLKATFQVFDEDHSGTIDPEEINKILAELGAEKRNPFIVSIIEALKGRSRPINFQQFLDVVCPRIGNVKTKQGLKTVFDHFDKSEDGVLDFQEFKAVARTLGDSINDQDILEMLHSTFISHKTHSNQTLTFQEFYEVVTQFHKR